MTSLETLVRIGLTDLADEVRPVDLRSRVAATRRRTRVRRRLLAGGLAGAVAASAVGAVALWPETPTTRQNVVATPPPPDPSLPASIDVSDAVPVPADARLRMIFQVAEPGGRLASYGLIAGSNDVVALTDLPALPQLNDPGISLDPPAQLSIDGTRLLLQPDVEERMAENAPPVVVDTRTGYLREVPFEPHDRVAGLAPDGARVAVLSLDAPVPCGWSVEDMCTGDEPPPTESVPWEMSIVDVATGAVSWTSTSDVLGAASLTYGASPLWSPDGSLIQASLAGGGSLEQLVVRVDDGTWARLPDPPAATAPWSPDGTRLVVEGASRHAYRVVGADPSADDFGTILASASTSGRILLGWSGDEQLLWYDRQVAALVETDLAGEPIGSPTPIEANGPVVAVLPAPAS